MVGENREAWAVLHGQRGMGSSSRPLLSSTSSISCATATWTRLAAPTKWPLRGHG